MRYTYRGPVLLALACVLYLEGYLYENLIPAFCALGIVMYMVFARIAFTEQLKGQRLEVNREVLEKMLFAKKPFTVLTRIRNLGGATRIEFEEVLPEGTELRTGVRNAKVDLNPGEVAKLKYTVEAHKRGYYTISEVRVKARDRAGLFEHSTVLQHDTKLRVHSSREELRRAHTIAKREHLEVLGKSPERWSRTREFEFAGIREYAPGDRFRDIDWKGFSRLLKLITKVYEREAMVPTTILLDSGRSMRVTMPHGSKLNHGIKLSMQLSRILLSGYHPTGVAVFDEMGTVVKVQPDVVRGQYDNILKALLHVPEEISTDQERQPIQIQRIHEVVHEKSEGQRFVNVVGAYIARSRKGTRVGAEGVVRNAIAKGGRGQMFMIISDLESNHDDVVRAASLARNHGYRVILISLFTSYFETVRKDLGVEQIEKMYEAYMAKMHSLAKLRRLGVLTIELGPRDEAVSVARHVRRMMA